MPCVGKRELVPIAARTYTSGWKEFVQRHHRLLPVGLQSRMHLPVTATQVALTSPWIRVQAAVHLLLAKLLAWSLTVTVSLMQSFDPLTWESTQIEKRHHQKDANMMRTTLLWGSLVLYWFIYSASVLYVQKYISQLDETFTFAQTFTNETFSLKK